ncbi:MAG: tail fiber domain-containing protein, partial [Ferruginibacter sp.]
GMLLTTAAFSQAVGIGTNTPDASALLEIKSNNKGILVPRTSSISRLAILNPAKGLMLYDTTTSSFWFHNGTVWAQIGTAANGWSLTGNAGTNLASDFLGTTDNLPLRFKTNNTWSGELNPITGNVYLGLKAGEQTNMGYSNVAIGVGALRLNTSQTNLVAIGDSALYNNGAGSSSIQAGRNTAIGSKSLFSNTFGTYNTATGDRALYSNITGNSNTATGDRALYSNTTGASNTATGDGALFSNTTGISNTAIGNIALYYNVKGEYNTAMGYYAARSNTAASNNTVIGARALFSQSFDAGSAWESNNVAIGFEALFSNSPTSTVNGINNTAVGGYALRANSTGWDNTGIGVAALYSNTVGIENTATGRQALFYNTSGSDNTASGYKALRGNNVGTFNTAMGAYALHSNTSGSLNTAVGDHALFTQSFDGGPGWASNNVAVGYNALYANQPTTTTNNGTDNTAIGNYALATNTTGYRNTANGYRALRNNNTGYFNTAAGADALFSNSSGFYNTAYGAYALANSSNANANTAVGYGSLYRINTGNQNTGVGYNTLYDNISGSFNTALGYNAYMPLAYSHDNSTCIGHSSGGASPYLTGSIEIGNSSVYWIGGQVGWSTYSDARIKDNVTESVPGLAFINRLRPVTYNLNIHKENEMIYKGKKEESNWDSKYDIEKIKMSGFIAQDVEKAAKEIGYDFSGVQKPADPEGLYSLRYADFVMPLVKAVQEQQVIIEKQNKNIEMLLKEIQQIKEQLNTVVINKKN